MESEEYEQIPWGNLVADAQPTVDRRIYVVGGVIAAIVAVVLVARMSSPGAAPPPVALAAPVTTISQAVDIEPTLVANAPPTAPPGVITEADLMAGVEPVDELADPLVVLVAEWFVTDFFTMDGSQETLASLEKRLGPDATVDLPHVEHSGPDQFVEWAKVFAVEPSTEGQQASVAFRTVRATEEGFVRDPVRAVLLELIRDGEGWFVQSMASSIGTP